MIDINDLDNLSKDELNDLEQQLHRLIASWQIQNLRATAWRFHDDQHVGDKRRELYADKHPGIDWESVKKSRMTILVDSLDGNTLIHPATTPIIEVNADCTQARALFMSFGYEALSIHREEPMAIWSMGYNTENYVVQDCEWRILCGGWQRTVKAKFEKGWVHDMQKTNTNPPLTEEEDRNYLGKYAYRKNECRKPVPEPPHENTFEEFPGEMNLDWKFYNLKG